MLLGAVARSLRRIRDRTRIIAVASVGAQARAAYKATASFAATAAVRVLQGSVAQTITAVASVAASARAAYKGQVSVSAISAVSAAGRAAYRAAVGIASEAGVSASARAAYLGSASLSAIAAASAAARAGYKASASFVADASVTAIAAPLESFDADAQAVIDNMDTEPTAGRQTLIHNLVIGLKDDGIWTLLDRLWIMAAHEQGATARLDWKSPATTGRRLTEVNSPSFTADQGYTGNGSTSYLNTNYTPSADGSQWTQNSACFGVWIRTAPPSAPAKYYFGADSTTAGRDVWAARNSANLALVAPQGGAINTTDGTKGGHTGLLTVNRSASDAVQSYLNGVEETTGTTTSAALVNVDVLLLCLTTGFGFSSGQLSIAFAASSLNAAQQANLHTRLNTYMAGL